MADAAVSRKGGLFWSAVSGGAQVVLPFVVFALFARMMAPAELSLVMLAVAMLELLKTLGPQGIYDVLLAHPEEDRLHHRTAGGLFLIGGLVLAGAYVAGVLLSPWILKATLPPVLAVLALKVVFDYAILQPQAILVGRGAMRRLGSRGIAAGLAAGLGGLAVAWVTSPLVGLAAYYVLQSLVAFLLTAVGTGSLLAPALDGAAAREMAGQGTRASGVRLTAAISNYLDQLLLGAMVVASAVGPYNLGKRVEVAVITLGGSFGQLLFQPTFAKAAPEERIGHVEKGMAAITLVCGLPAVLLAVFHREAVPFVFGRQWSGAAAVVALLALNGYVRALGSIPSALMTVTRRNGRLLAMTSISAATNMLMIVLFARFGVIGATLAILTRNMVQVAAMLALTRDAAGHMGRLFARYAIVPLAATGAVAWAAGRGAASLLTSPSPVAVMATVAIGSAAGGAVGFALLRRHL